MPEPTPVIDGFSMNAALRYLPMRYFPTALAGLRNLRQHAGEYRCRHLAVPADNQTTIPFNQAFKCVETVIPGSWLYGYNFAALNGAVGDYRVEVSIRGPEDCAPARLWSTTVQAPVLRPTGAAGADLYPVLIDPLLIGEPGLIDVRIANMQTGVDGRCQLMLTLAEPCYVVTTRGPGGKELR